MIEYWLLAAAIIIVAGLAFYAGRLMFQLRKQTTRHEQARQNRIARISESVNTIALAVEQQQCNLSEGAIRLVNLLDSMPVESPPNCQRDYPALYELYNHVRDLPTHQERKALSPEVRDQQDKIRENVEAELEQKILQEVAAIRQLSFD